MHGSSRHHHQAGRAGPADPRLRQGQRLGDRAVRPSTTAARGRDRREDHLGQVGRRIPDGQVEPDVAERGPVAGGGGADGQARPVDLEQRLVPGPGRAQPLAADRAGRDALHGRDGTARRVGQVEAQGARAGR